MICYVCGTTQAVGWQMLLWSRCADPGPNARSAVSTPFRSSSLKWTDHVVSLWQPPLALSVLHGRGPCWLGCYGLYGPRRCDHHAPRPTSPRLQLISEKITFWTGSDRPTWRIGLEMIRFMRSRRIWSVGLHQMDVKRGLRVLYRLQPAGICRRGPFIRTSYMTFVDTW